MCLIFFRIQSQRRAHHSWVQRKIFKLKVLRRLENAIFIREYFIIELCYLSLAQHIQSVLEMLSYQKSTMGPVWLGPKKIFQNRGSQKAGKRDSKVANTVNASFNFTFFQLLYKHYVVVNSSKTA